jgi:hypothetical protein
MCREIYRGGGWVSADAVLGDMHQLIRSLMETSLQIALVSDFYAEKMRIEISKCMSTAEEKPYE